MATGTDPSPDRRLIEIEDELYGVPPEDFVRRRGEAARAAARAGDRDLAAAIASLRKPTAAAWVLDSFARSHDTTVDALLDLGGRMRAAVDRGDGSEIREVMRERAAAVLDAMREVHRHASDLGAPLSGSVAAQVERTIRAAMATEAGGRLLRRGVLAVALDEPGLDALSAVPATDPPAAARTGRRPRSPSSRDRSRFEAAERRAAAAADAVEVADEVLDAATARRHELEAVREQLRRQLDDVETDLREARASESEAEAASRTAHAELRAARAAVHRGSS